MISIKNKKAGLKFSWNKKPRQAIKNKKTGLKFSWIKKPRQPIKNKKAGYVLFLIFFLFLLKEKTWSAFSENKKSG